MPLDDTQANYLKAISEWLSTFDVAAGKVQLRLELQYEESKDFLSTLIQGQQYVGEVSASIQKMRGAYERIKEELDGYLLESVEALTEFAVYASSLGDYQSLVYRLGNVTLLESNINQAVNNFNDLNGEWFTQKLGEYGNSALLGTKMLDSNFSVGNNTKVNSTKALHGLGYGTWDVKSISHRQAVLLELAMETWKLNGQRLDAVIADEAAKGVQ